MKLNNNPHQSIVGFDLLPGHVYRDNIIDYDYKDRSKIIGCEIASPLECQPKTVTYNSLMRPFFRDRNECKCSSNDVKVDDNEVKTITSKKEVVDMFKNIFIYNKVKL